MPYVPLGASPQGFYSFENAEDRAQTATIFLTSDSGQLLRGAELTVPGGQLAHINSQDILNGNPTKGVSVTVVAQPREGEAAWALVTTPANMWVRAYVRAPSGFVSGMSATLEEYVSSGGYSVEHATFFNPGSNTSIVSVLRILNVVLAGSRTAVIAARDAHKPLVRTCHLPDRRWPRTHADRARARGRAGPECSGRLGDGMGKWRLFVRPDNTTDFWFSSMSQLWTAAGIVTNVSFPEPYHFTKR